MKNGLSLDLSKTTPFLKEHEITKEWFEGLQGNTGWAKKTKRGHGNDCFGKLCFKSSFGGLGICFY